VTALPRGGRLAAIVFAALLSGLLVIATAASAATRATLTASAAKARGCHTDFVGNRAHTDVVRVRSNVEGLLRARLKSRGDWTSDLRRTGQDAVNRGPWETPGSGRAASGRRACFVRLGHRVCTILSTQSQLHASGRELG
jgi:hypothetical protein